MFIFLGNMYLYFILISRSLFFCLISRYRHTAKERIRGKKKKGMKVQEYAPINKEFKEKVLNGGNQVRDSV